MQKKYVEREKGIENKYSSTLCKFIAAKGKWSIIGTNVIQIIIHFVIIPENYGSG